MPKNLQVKQGNFYKKKTKDYFLKLGYQCELTEKNTAKFIPNRGVFYTKSDLFGSDGMAMNGRKIVFWNSKSTEDITKRRNEILKEGARVFRSQQFPPFVILLIVIWAVKARTPEVYKISHDDLHIQSEEKVGDNLW